MGCGGGGVCRLFDRAAPPRSGGMILRAVAWLLPVLALASIGLASAATSENVGTWIEVHPTPLSASDQAIAYHIDGLPPTACDHSTLHIGGGKLWTWAGASENDPNTFYSLHDMWILDLAVEPPAWSILPVRVTRQTCRRYRPALL